MRERGLFVQPQAGFVRAALSEDVAHPQRASARIRVERCRGDEPCDAAHGYAAARVRSGRSAPST